VKMDTNKQQLAMGRGNGRAVLIVGGWRYEL
jgi:hypothetical protein